MAVNTPTKKVCIGAGRAAGLTYSEIAAHCIAYVSQRPKIVVEKSSVPIEMVKATSAMFYVACKTRFDVLRNPEFLAEGTAVIELDAPDRVLIGSVTADVGR